jgi:tRNA-splicing ligase RtcB (3'-phosphate/5'-hydroxy nucleic acid ligase)
MMERLGNRLFSWASILEPNTREQAERTASMPFIWPHVAIMPDAHWGRGATVGTVMPTVGAIIPAAVGVDIGCGMNAHCTSLKAEQLADPALRRRIRERIERMIPLSPGNYNQKLWSRRTEGRVNVLAAIDGAEDATQIADWDMQLGSLGGGNHFIEISVDERGFVWMFLHSGSRGVGNKLANKYIKAAQDFCEKNWISLPDSDLAYLVEGTQEFDDYLRCLFWAQEFARLNREEMMDRVRGCLEQELGSDGWYVTDRVQCHHNYTERMDWSLLKHYKMPATRGNVWLTRKGAIDASEGKPGLIPGSMGTASYVVTGLGDPLSLYSSPHGAGRQYSRSAARKAFTRADLDAAMQGIEWGQSDEFLDEIPGAYKDIDTVMHDAAKLVRIDHNLHQIINVKGK